MICNICPRKCNIDRGRGKGFCHEGNKIRVSKIIENFCWEEPCLSGKKGTLVIFFSGCNLRCEFCQNYEISHVGKGQEYSISEFVSLLQSYDYSKLDSVDLITPTQFSVDLISALQKFKPPVPVIWNSSGYESEGTIKALAKVVDVFLVDFKFYDSALSQRLAGASDYFEVASRAVKLMSQLKTNVLKNEMMTQGVLIRHLILPGNVKDSLRVLDFIADEIKCPFVSIMSQFTPNGHGELKRKLTPLECKAVLAHAERIGLTQGYFQDLNSADDKFIPKF